MKLLLLLLGFAPYVLAAQPDLNDYSSSLEFAQVTDVHATQNVDGNWCIATSIRHNDQGWDHYADGWEVLDLQGNKIGFRKLHHPHVNEQPFTRSQCDIKVPSGVTKIIVRAKCNKHGFGGKALVIEL